MGQTCSGIRTGTESPSPRSRAPSPPSSDTDTDEEPAEIEAFRRAIASSLRDYRLPAILPPVLPVTASATSIDTVNPKEEAAEQEYRAAVADSIASWKISELEEQKRQEEDATLLRQLDQKEEHNDPDRTCYHCFAEVQWSTPVLKFPCGHWVCAQPSPGCECPIPSSCGICRREVPVGVRRLRGLF